MYALISLNLNNLTESSQRQDFYSYLEDKHFIKSNKLDTVWFINYNSTDEDAIISTTKNHIQHAAIISKTIDYDVIIGVCKNKPIEY
jgi:hypothetical protein